MSCSNDYIAPPQEMIGDSKQRVDQQNAPESIFDAASIERRSLKRCFDQEEHSYLPT